MHVMTCVCAIHCRSPALFVLQYLENDDYSWTVSVHTIPKPTISAAAVPDTRDAESVHYLYVCKKGGTAEEGA